MSTAMTSDGMDANSSPGEPANGPKTLLDQTYRRLRDDIIMCAHEPGAKLQIERLREQYGVSAGTIREALSRLIADSLVVAIEQRGFRVASVSPDDLEDLTETRVLLETQALRKSIMSGDDRWEANLVGAFHLLTRAERRLVADAPGSVVEWEERNRAYHEALVAACPSVWLKKLSEILYRQSIRYRFISALSKDSHRNVHDEHTAIFDAAMRRDAEVACARLAEHIRVTASVVERAAITKGRPAAAAAI